jgi:hypothetical protein
MEGQLPKKAALAKRCRRILNYKIASSLSLLILGLYVCQPASAAQDICPAASAGFSPKLFYPADTQTVANALGNTLRALAIPVASAENSHIVTDNLAGPTSDTNGQVTSSRYRFDIHLIQMSGKTHISIATLLETASGPAGGPPGSWHNVTLLHIPSSLVCNKWLSEAFEHTFNGQPAVLTAQTTSASAGSTAGATGAAPVLGVQLKQQAAPASSQFDGGLGSSGDIGAGASPASAGTSSKPAQTRTH